MSLRSLRTPIAIAGRCAGIIALLGVGFAGYLVATFDSPPFDLERLQLLAPGMAEKEVEALLGSPRTRARQPAGEDGPAETCWVYSRPFSWPTVYVYFDREGRYRAYRRDF
jgi:hypothetical protein